MPFDSDGQIRVLDAHEVFCFGSNRQGRHGRGAALTAAKQFGAVYGVGEGLTGKCYAFPTCDYVGPGKTTKLSWPHLVDSFSRFRKTAGLHPELTFLVTKVGCGLAGYPEDRIRSIFEMTSWPSNCVFPPDWNIRVTVPC